MWSVNGSPPRGSRFKRVWVPSTNAALLWEIVEVCNEERDANGLIEVRSPKGDQRKWKVRPAECWTVDPSHDDASIDDVSELNELHAAPLLATLRRRWAAGAIYTRAGPVLLAVNPHRNIPDQPGPHVRDVALEALRGAVERGRSQAVVISGESGAGKTVSATRIIEYLVECGASSSNVRKRESIERREQSKVELLSRLSASIPALEALGNASTALNANSSRFGKLIKLSFEFDDTGRREIVGASIDEFLLEKARVATRLDARVMCERNFHVLHQLGGDSRAYTQVHPVDAATAQLRAYCEPKTFAQSKRAFQDLGISQADADLTWRVGEAVLHLGDDDIAAAARCLSIDVAALEDVTRERRCVGRGNDEDAFVKYEASERTRVVDGLAKLLYAALFNRLVLKANAALAEPLAEYAHEFGEAATARAQAPTADGLPPPPGALQGNGGGEVNNTFVGILDIYGFEIFQTNSLDQLLINYANEVLQKAFDEALVQAECERYAKDQVPWVQLDMARVLESAAVVRLIAQLPNGLLPLLDEQVKLGERGSDAAFLSQADKKHAAEPNYSKPRLDRDSFIVNHYAAQVTYAPQGFLLKNSDPLSLDVSLVIASSADPGVRALISASTAQAAAPPTGLPMSRPSGAVSNGGDRASMRSFLPQLAESTSRKFREQMKSLEATIAACDAPAQYVRCVRPNDEGRADVFDASKVLRQLTSSGVMDLIKVRDAGFPERLPPTAFLREFGALLVLTDDAALVGDTQAVKVLRKRSVALGEFAALDAANWALARERNAKALVSHRTTAAARIAAAEDDVSLDAVCADVAKQRAALATARDELCAFADGSDVLCEAAALAACELELGFEATYAGGQQGLWALGQTSRHVYLKRGMLARLRSRVDQQRGLHTDLDDEAKKDAAVAKQRRVDQLIERARVRALDAANAAQAAAKARVALERLDLEAKQRETARGLVASRVGARHRSAVVRRDVALAALVSSTERAAEMRADIARRIAAAQIRAEGNIVGHKGTKPHGTVARLDAQAAESLDDVDRAVADAFLCAALQKNRQQQQQHHHHQLVLSSSSSPPSSSGMKTASPADADQERRTLRTSQAQNAGDAIAMAQTLDRLVNDAKDAVFILETEVGHVEDAQRTLALRLQAQQRMRAARAAYAWAQKMAQPWRKLDILTANEIILFASPVALRVKPTSFLDQLLDKLPFVDATALTTNTGRLVLLKRPPRKGAVDQALAGASTTLEVLPHASFDKGGNCCGPSGSVNAVLNGNNKKPTDQPACVVVHDAASSPNRKKKNGDAAFIDVAATALTNWKALSKKLNQATKTKLTPLDCKRFEFSLQPKKPITSCK